MAEGMTLSRPERDALWDAIQGDVYASTDMDLDRVLEVFDRYADQLAIARQLRPEADGYEVEAEPEIVRSILARYIPQLVQVVGDDARMLQRGPEHPKDAAAWDEIAQSMRSTIEREVGLLAATSGLRCRLDHGQTGRVEEGDR